MKKESKGGRPRRLSWGLALCCAAVFCIRAVGTDTDGGMGHASAAGSAVTSDSIKAKENQIAAKNKEKDALKKGLSDLQAIRKSLESKKNDLKNYVQELDGTLSQIMERIADLKAQIAAKEEELLRTQAELEAAQKQEADQQEAMAAHIRLSYEAGNPGVTDLLLTARNFGDFLNRMDFLEKLEASDQQMWQDYRAVKEYVQLCKEELEVEKELLDETKAGVEIEQGNLEKLIEQKKNDLQNYEADIDSKERAIKEYEEELKAQEEEIRLLEAAVAEERRKLIASRKAPIYDGGTFKFPMASYTAMTSDYGNRPDPFLGVERFHSGIDFAAPGGTPIYAAYDGEVVAAAYSTSMGNYVMIDHGSGLYTIYMHASALYVSKGAKVVKGDTIAAVGTTGRSTGNHLHFSVRLDGAYVSPWNYLKQ